MDAAGKVLDRKKMEKLMDVYFFLLKMSVSQQFSLHIHEKQLLVFCGVATKGGILRDCPSLTIPPI